MKTPKAAPAPVVPTYNNTQAAQDAAAAEQARQAALRGRSSTILSGGEGLSDMGATSSSKLLGL